MDFNLEKFGFVIDALVKLPFYTSTEKNFETVVELFKVCDTLMEDDRINPQAFYFIVELQRNYILTELALSEMIGLALANYMYDEFRYENSPNQ